MKAKQMVLAFLASAAMVVNGAIDPSGDTSGANDAAAIQSAIDAAANGGTVTLGSGMFYINTQLYVTNGVTLAGQGWDNTVIRQKTSGQRVATVAGGAKLVGVAVTGGKTAANWHHGAGVLVEDGTVSWCCVTNNTSTGRNIYGVGVSFKKGSIDHSIVAFNHIDSFTSAGGGIGAYYDTSKPSEYGSILVDTCLVYGNSMVAKNGSGTAPEGRGGGVGFSGTQFSDVTIRNTTIAGNDANYEAGGLYFNTSNMKLVNCIVSGNTVNSVEDNVVGTPASGSSNNLVGGDPAFVDAASGNYHLSASSPAIGGGVTYEGIDVDLDNVAFLDPPSMGCYQSGGVAKVDAPVFAPASGTRFYPSTNVTITCGTDNASIYYTLDGSDPTDSSTLYSGPIALEATTTIKSRAYKTDMAPSAVVAATYTYKAPAPKPDGFLKCVDITLSTNLAANAITTGVPALVRLSETTISGFDYDDFSFANGGDMMFTDANGDPLPHEIDTWNTAGESLVWVKIPSTDSGTTISMYYGSNAATGDSTDVWTDYVGVWHFDAATADTAANSYGMYANSTATAGIDGHIAEHTKTNETGRFGKCFRTNDSTGWKAGNFNYGGVWVNDSGTGSPVDGGQNFTISGWFKHDQLDYYWDHLFYKRSRSDNGTSGAYVNAFAIESNSGTGSNPQIYPRGSGNKGKALLSENQGLQNTWAYITFVYDGAEVRVFKNGIETDWTTIDACIDNDAPLVFGNNCNVASGAMGDAAWNGWIDEVRFSKGSKNATWVAAEYAAMNASGTDIFTYGTAQDVGPETTVRSPVFAPVSGTTFYPSTNVTLACATADASIYYTLDGSEPTDSNTLYDGPIAISATTTIKARAYKQDMDPSAIISATYTYEEPVTPLEPIALGEVSARPGTDYNGNSVAVAFTGDIPAGAAVAASITIGGVDYAGVVDAANGVMTFAVPANVVTAGNTYEGTITLTVDGDSHTTNVSLVQGTPNVEDNSNWINETAATLGSTGSWSGDKAEVAAGVIAVSNATFAASTAAPKAAVVTVTSTFCFGDPSDEAFDISSRAGITVVDVGGVNRYAFLTANGAVTNLSVVANTASAVEVSVTLDGTANTVSYSVSNVSLGTYPMTVKATGISTVHYDGPAEVAALNGAYHLEELDTNVAQVGGVGYPTVAEALAAAGNDPVALLWDASWTPATTGDYLFTTNGHALAIGGAFAHSVVDNGNGTVTITITEQSNTVDLRISEVGSAVTDPWGNTSSFIEIYNNGTSAVNIEGFILRREQKGKTKDIALPAYTLAAGAYVVVWGSDDNPYENPAVVVSGNVIREGIMKFKAGNTPKITLLDNANNELDSFQMVAGLADGQSMGPSADFDGVNLYYFGKKKITPGAANNYEGATALGADFVSTTHSADEVALDADLAVTSTWAPLIGSTIAGVKMFYRLAFSNEVEVAMSDSGDGLTWTATIPASVYASATPGSLIRWRFVATDSFGRTTKEPAFGSADSSPEYYGTITASGIECDLPVFHLFVAEPGVGTDIPDDPTDDPRNFEAMDIDSDALATASSGAYADMTIGARCSIYHDGHLYDNVTIDLRGNTSAGFQKKSHGLKFNKSDKLVYVNPYTGETGTVRKTSFTAEFMDPSFMRQNVSFRFLNAVGSPAPFHYPVRLQRNGEFYQLGFHSIRFTDEIVDYYGWDDDCELVKNAGSLRKTESTAGFETKIPEQDNESLPTDNFRALVSDLRSSDRSVRAWDILNIPMWINYMAATRITQETDDVWGNLCVYRHNKTGTWWPGAYDMNLSFGQYYKEAGWTDFWGGEISNEDTFKCHPLYGGSQVRVYNKGTTTVATVGGGSDVNYNGAFDAIYGDAKLRGMHLRRLRTLMDAWLKEPGTAQADTPIWQFFASQTNAMAETAGLDRAKWRNINSGGIINIWGGEYGNNFKTNIVQGVEAIWNKYLVPRRTHLYVTHSATNATYDAESVFTVVDGGTVVCHNAGIPESQPAGLKVRVSRRVLDADGTNTYIKVDNPNAIFLDVSEWTVSDGTTTVVLEPGTVIPPAGALYLVADRKAFTAAHPRAQVLLQGNIKAALVSSGAALTVTDADGATAATSSAVATAPGEETITEDADPFSAEPSQPVIGSRTGSDELVGLSIVKGEGDDDTMYLVIPFAAEAGFTYTLKTSTSLLTPVSEWAPAAGVATISLSADGDAEFRVPMNGTAAFFVISAE